jgi:peptidoglycan/LPS O-acetylase OafA/YrhL
MTLDYSSPIFFLPIIVIIFICAGILAKKLPFYKKILEDEGKGRYETLDGLRGFLAFGVFFQHAITNWAFYNTGTWVITDVRFYRFLGGESVILFFMITSFLYWSKAIAKKGELNVSSLYRNRIYRLAPMYLFSALLVTIFALYETGFKIAEPFNFLKEILSWLTLGLITTLTVNGNNVIPINSGIHWTLHFEWVFYLLFPAAAVTLRRKSLYFLAIPLLAIVALAPDRGYWMIFFFGIAAAHVINLFPTQKWLLKHWTAILPILGLIAVYLIQYKPYGLIQYCITFLVFLCFIYGNDLFGLLRTSAAKFLGTISYSIYLIHGIVLYLVLRGVDYFYPIVFLSPEIYWTIMAVAAVLVLIISAITFRYIEYPFLHKTQSKPQGTGSAIADRVM